MLDLILCCYKLPEDGTLVLKYVGVFTYNVMCLMFCCVCVFFFWGGGYLVHSVDEYIEYKKMHGMNNIGYKIN
jgi:hypothetical protein